MGCFFACFRIKHDDNHRPQTHLFSDSLNPKPIEPVESRNCLSSFLLSKEKDDSSCKDKENHLLGTAQLRIDDRDLKDEAKFLKACGTLLETPTEIRKASEKLKDSSPSDGDSEVSKFHSWLPRTSFRKLNLDEQPDQPSTPTNLREDTSGSRIHNGHDGGRTSPSSIVGGATGSVTKAFEPHANQIHNTGTSSHSPRTLASNVQIKNKSVQFECESDVNSFSSISSSSSEVASENSKQYESAAGKKSFMSKASSPYPTPLKLTDEMQTPGTVYPAYIEDSTAKNWKNPRIRSQYVYSVPNPVDNFSQWKVVKDEEDTDSATLQSEVRIRETSADKELRVEESLSSWLKPKRTSDQDGIKLQFGENTHVGRTPGDRPILGMVAAHWNEDEFTRISPKWWDGNGIPNSTNKYKEDQKVSWHATPFEERLEKALSEDSFISQRKHIIGTPPIEYDENEEGDTALSQLQSSTQIKPVVTF